MNPAKVLKKYMENSRAIRRSYNNPLKKTENISLKNELEQQFYDEEAEKYLANFRDDVFLYDENETMPTGHKQFYLQLKDSDGKKILDICCGHGFTSVRLAKIGAQVTGIDVSPKMIELAQKNAEFNDVDERISTRVMSVQAMDFADQNFDFVVGIGALHHLNLETAGHEISRVLKKGGKAIFLEPRIPFKWLIFVRSVFPNKCFESPGGAQLTDKEIRIFSGFFSKTKVDYFLFLRKLARFPILNKLSDHLDKYDAYLINRFPFLKKFYWAFLLQFTK
ncbi:MAG: class I SAM-dependent methyltransferase [Calditrichaeota bacterium]|nr:class I SAM-dependent methyltransferase [Calditrichota bacterium]